MTSTGCNVVLTGIIQRRIKKYATEEEKAEGKLASYKKYASKKYYCQTCDKTMSIYNYSDHVNTKIHLKNSLKNAA